MKNVVIKKEIIICLSIVIPKNQDLTVLEPAKNVSKQLKISSELYEFKKDNTYSIQGKFNTVDKNSITIPY